MLLLRGRIFPVSVACANAVAWLRTLRSLPRFTRGSPCPPASQGVRDISRFQRSEWLCSAAWRGNECQVRRGNRRAGAKMSLLIGLFPGGKLARYGGLAPQTPCGLFTGLGAVCDRIKSLRDKFVL